jgi:hypothetical protein
MLSAMAESNASSGVQWESNGEESNGESNGEESNCDNGGELLCGGSGGTACEYRLLAAM